MAGFGPSSGVRLLAWLRFGLLWLAGAVLLGWVGTGFQRDFVDLLEGRPRWQTPPLGGDWEVAVALFALCVTVILVLVVALQSALGWWAVGPGRASLLALACLGLLEVSLQIIDHRFPALYLPVPPSGPALPLGLGGSSPPSAG